ncbi:hypothetical protein D3C84_1039210 [compost metagenome]
MTTAEPEMAPAAPALMASRTWAGSLMPKPSRAGGALNSRKVLMRPSTGMPALVSAPVTPARLTR